LNNILSLISSNSLQVRVTWIPSHIGIFGNERADAAALEAASKDFTDIILPYERSEIQTIVDTVTHQEIEDWWSGVTSLYSRVAPRWVGCYTTIGTGRAAETKINRLLGW
jgi:hypothetical protein